MNQKKNPRSGTSWIDGGHSISHSMHLSHQQDIGAWEGKPMGTAIGQKNEALGAKAIVHRQQDLTNVATHLSNPEPSSNVFNTCSVCVCVRMCFSVCLCVCLCLCLFSRLPFLGLCLGETTMKYLLCSVARSTQIPKVITFLETNMSKGRFTLGKWL